MVSSLVDTQMGIIDCNTKHNFNRNSSMLSCFAIDGPYKRREKTLFYRINTDSEKARRRAAFYEGYESLLVCTARHWVALYRHQARLARPIAAKGSSV